MDWTYLDAQVEPFFAVGGRPAIPSRLMIGLHLLKQMHQLSDEAVCARWVEPLLPVFLRGGVFLAPVSDSAIVHDPLAAAGVQAP